jgi:hypothetical protein
VGTVKKVHRGDELTVIFQEGLPRLDLVRAWFSPRQIPGNGAFRNIKPDLQELAMYSWGSPRRIFAGHATDQTADLDISPRPARRP